MIKSIKFDKFAQGEYYMPNKPTVSTTYTDDTVYDFGMILQTLRKKHGLTQEQLASKINKESSIISRYEKNLQCPTFDTVKAFSSIFNVSMDYLSGTEKHSSLSTYGLTDSQIQILQELIEFFRNKNASIKIDSTEGYALIGKLVSCIM